MRRRARFSLLGCALCLGLLSEPAAASTAAEPQPAPSCTASPTADRYQARAIGLLYRRARERRVIEKALALWRGCPNYGADFPGLVVGDDRDLLLHELGATSLIEVEMVAGVSPDGRCGHFRGNRILLYGSARTSTGARRSCRSSAMNLAHELGHALGLSDSPDTPACEQTIMSSVESSNAFRRAVSPQECSAAGVVWQTFAEMEHEPAVGVFRAAELVTVEAPAQDERRDIRASRPEPSSSVLPVVHPSSGEGGTPHADRTGRDRAGSRRRAGSTPR